jgi:hypothetical protein
MGRWEDEKVKSNVEVGMRKVEKKKVGKKSV